MSLTRDESASLDRLELAYRGHRSLRPLMASAPFNVLDVGAVVRALARVARGEGPKPLTPKQHRVLVFIARSLEANGYAPTYSEIADAMVYNSLATVHEFLDILCRKGYLLRRGSPGAVRDIELTDAGAAWWAASKEAAA